MGRTKAPEPWSPIVVGCRSEQAAAALARSLRGYGDMTGVEVDGRLVKVPWSGAEAFLRGLFDGAVERGWVAPETATTAVRTRLAEVERRRRQGA